MHFLPLAFAILLAAEPLASGDHARNLQGRSYLVHVPPKCQQPTPVVLAFHGGGSNVEQMVRFCGGRPGRVHRRLPQRHWLDEYAHLEWWQLLRLRHEQ